MKQKLLFIVMFILGCVTSIKAESMDSPMEYAVLKDGVLTLYYDTERWNRVGTVYEGFVTITTPSSSQGGMGWGDALADIFTGGWTEAADQIKRVVFDPSFADFTDFTSTKCWFRGCTNLQSVSGLEYLNTKNVTDMGGMFSYCTSLKSIDVSKLNTGNVKTFYYKALKSDGGLFGGCKNLTSIDFGWKSKRNMETFDGATGLSGDKLPYTGTSFTCGVNGELSIGSREGYLKVRTGNKTTSEGHGTLTFNVNEGYKIKSLRIEGFSNNTSTEADRSIYMKKMYVDGNVIDGEGFTFPGGTAGTDAVSKMYSNIDASKSIVFEFDNSNIVSKEEDENGRNKQIMMKVEITYENLSGTEETIKSSFTTKNIENMSEMFAGCSSLTSLDLSGFDTHNVTDMSSMFDNCSSLTSLDLSSFETKNVTDMRGMFSRCSSLTSLDLSNFNTENVLYMGSAIYGAFTYCGMFDGCSSLTSLDLSNFNTPRLMGMGYMFSGCSSLTSLDLSGFDTHNVTDMNNMFSGCSSFTSLDLTGFVTHCVINMSDMFSGCSNLTSLDLSSFNTLHVTDMSEMFSNCSKLSKITTGEYFIIDYIDKDYYMFDKCINLVGQYGATYDKDAIDKTKAYVGKGGYFWGVPVTSTRPYAVFNNGTLTFYYDANMNNRPGIVYGNLGETIYILNGYQVPAWGNEREAVIKVVFDSSFSDYHYLNSTRSWFALHKFLTTIEGIENLHTENVTDMYDMFSSCSSLTSLNLSNFDTKNVTSMNYMFSGCSSLTSLDLSNFDTKNVTSMYYMFSGCSSLTSLDLSSFDTHNVKDMSGMFSSCSSFTSLDLSSFDTHNVKDMSGMFSSCSSFTSLDLSGFSTQNVTDMRDMFSGCSNLEAIYVSDAWNTNSVTSSSSMFSGCSNIIGEDYTEYSSSYTDVSKAHYNAGGYLRNIANKDLARKPYAYAMLYDGILTFYYDSEMKSRKGSAYKTFDSHFGSLSNKRSSITKVVFDSSFADYSELMSTEYMFYCCSSLTEIQGLENLNVASIGSYAFYQCTGLTSITIPKSVTSIDSYAFRGCTGLTSITIPKSVTSIGRHAFYGCAGLTSITIPSGVTWIDDGAFYNCTGLTNIYSMNPVPPYYTYYNTFNNCYSATLYVPKGSKEAYANANYWNKFSNIVEIENAQEIDPITKKTYIVFNESNYVNADNSSVDLNNTVVDNTYFCIDNTSNAKTPDGFYSVDEQCIVISKTTLSDAMATAAASELGSSDFTSNYTGMVIEVNGKGSITVSAQTTGGNRLAVKIGNAEATTYTLAEKGDVTVSYNVTENTYVYIYAVDADNQQQSVSMDVTATAENAVKVYSITVTPSVTAIESVAASTPAAAFGKVYSIDGKRLSQPQKGLNIIRMSDGTTRKIVSK